MPSVKVKICGITRLEDALLAVRLGADALGFNFWPGSKRFIPPAAAGEIVRRLPPGVETFGVFVDASREELLAALSASGVTVAQLHGDEPPALCASLPVPAVKAIRVEGPSSLAALAAYEVPAFLLDAPGPGFGGSGRTFDWSLAFEAARAARVFLAGGLTPENVGEAVRRVRPYGVDVASGVESAPGVKDEDKLRRFIQAAKEAAR
ncbi:phosphoribosylanthranilate isomerase [Anaeromyxobacter sp. SG66]|uniref:phosphoribosylanthranilate isomerase n=1 Tax=Anaeromyxobacter sp. SG66 TaxID=2925410 RepID=UPI001F59BBA3|nr:phosphoribosylanthranilate isomerase [Anaeromyxobacter sp. SG66]